MLCCGYTLTDLSISTRLTSLALWQSNDCPSASKARLMNMDKYCMWIHYERLHNHNKAKHNKTVCIFLGIYCILDNVHRYVFRYLSGIGDIQSFTDVGSMSKWYITVMTQDSWQWWLASDQLLSLIHTALGLLCTQITALWPWIRNKPVFRLLKRHFTQNI